GHHEPRSVAEARALETAPQLPEDPIGQGQVVDIPRPRSGEAPRRETSGGAIVDAWRLWNGQVEEHEPEAAVGRGANGQVVELLEPPDGQPAKVRGRREARPLVAERLAERVAAHRL